MNTDWIYVTCPEGCGQMRPDLVGTAAAPAALPPPSGPPTGLSARAMLDFVGNAVDKRLDDKASNGQLRREIFNVKKHQPDGDADPVSPPSLPLLLPAGSRLRAHDRCAGPC